MAESMTITGLIHMAVFRGDPWYQALLMDLMLRVFAAPFLINFVCIPMLAGVLQNTWSILPFCWITLINMAGAEVFTNLHAFCTIVTNHAGSDMWTFNDTCKADTAEFYVRAILGSTAYHAGNDLVDYYHGYLNYQAEHHTFPSLTPLHYQRLHPQFKQVCGKHGVPYVQEPVWVRTKKTADVMVGVASHRRMAGHAVDQPELWACKKTKAE